MNPETFIIKPDDRRPAINVVGAKMNVLASYIDTQGIQVTVASGSEGVGPPPHSHDWDESFYVTAGEVLFSCGGKTTNCVTGTFVHIPADTIHAFSFGPDGGEVLEMTEKRSHAVEMFTALDREIAPGPPDVPKLIKVLSENGVNVHT
ncbi:cupin domain-containing protein [Alcaligenaceae bacterium]|nr:cupin domain-containing protein [Alcaligenaceae bacterium]